MLHLQLNQTGSALASSVELKRPGARGERVKARNARRECLENCICELALPRRLRSSHSEGSVVKGADLTPSVTDLRAIMPTAVSLVSRRSVVCRVDGFNRLSEMKPFTAVSLARRYMRDQCKL